MGRTGEIQQRQLYGEIDETTNGSGLCRFVRKVLPTGRTFEWRKIDVNYLPASATTHGKRANDYPGIPCA